MVIGERYMRALVRGARGRAWLLRFLAAAEVDEHDVFDTLLARIDDAELQKLVRVHRDDEKRHFAMVSECLERYDVEPPAVLPEHRVAFHVDRLLGGFARSFEEARTTVMEAYALLYVLEELTVRIYPLIVRALDGVDGPSARVVERVLRDEERHVKYARAISRRYAPDDFTLERTVRRMRDIEKRASLECNRITLRYAVANELLEVPTMEKMFWRAAARVA